MPTETRDLVTRWPASGPAPSLLRELPADDRPRERLLEHGARALSDSEVVAVLLGTGTRGVSALDLARRLLGHVGGLEGLRACGAEDLEVPGVGPAKRCAVLAACELAVRLARSSLPHREPLSRPAAAARYLDLRYGRVDQEVMGALFLDTRHRLIREEEVFRGTLGRAAVEPRPILKRGLLLGAAAFLLFHTHPSGDPSPSAEDLAFTRRLRDAGELVGISLLDHLVLGRGGAWVSLRERMDLFG